MNANAEGWGKSLQARDELLLRLSPVIRKVAKGYAMDEDHADDLVQECLVRVAVKLPGYREQEAGSIEAWAAKTADNLCRSLVRAGPVQHRCREDEHYEVPDPAPLPDEQLEETCRSAALRAAVERLPQRERAAIELVHFEGLPYAEAAGRLGVGAKAVRASVCRGVHALRGMPDLAAWRESCPGRAVFGTHRPGLDDGQHPVLALEPEPKARERIRAGVRFGNIDRLLDGVCFAGGWRDLRTLAGHLPGCLVIVDPGCSGARRSGMEELKRFRADLPVCPIVGYGQPWGSWCRNSICKEIGFVAILHMGVDDDPAAVRLALLRAADCDETERLLDRMRDRVPKGMHRFVDGVMHQSLTRCSVVDLAATMGITPRTLTRKCRTHGLPTPKRLLSLAVVFHVERLARWSGHRQGPTALALGFSDTADYRRLVKRTLGATPTEVARKGGPGSRGPSNASESG